MLPGGGLIARAITIPRPDTRPGTRGTRDEIATPKTENRTTHRKTRRKAGRQGSAAPPAPALF